MPGNWDGAGEEDAWGCSGLWAAPQGPPFRAEVSLPRHMALGRSPLGNGPLSGAHFPSCDSVASVWGQGSEGQPHKPTWDNCAGPSQLGGTCAVGEALRRWWYHSPASPSTQACFCLSSGTMDPPPAWQETLCRKIISEPALQWVYLQLVASEHFLRNRGA